MLTDNTFVVQIYIDGENESVVMLAASVVDGIPTLSDDLTNELPSAGYSFVAIDPTGSVR